MNGDGVDWTDNNSQLLSKLNKRLHYGYLRLYSDHKYTFLGENISAMHSWSLNRIDSTLTIDSFIDENNLRFRLLENDNNWLKLNLTAIGETSIMGNDNTFVFENSPYFESGMKDLLSYPYNAWRIKPDHKETYAEIMKRVMAHVDFMIAYYQMIEDEQHTSFMPMYLQTILRFYQNGIGISAEVPLDKGWESCFYDHADALAGQKILEDAIGGMGRYPDAATYTEGYLKALKQMKEYLEKIK
jgi:hypothetical protein